jgi:hypothetical protein
MRSARLLAIKPWTFNLDTADCVHFLQGNYAEDETPSAVEWLQECLGGDYVKFSFVSTIIVRTDAIHVICVCVKSVTFSFQDPQIQAYRQMLPHSGPGSK